MTRPPIAGPSAGGRVVLHVGLPKTGTTYLQGLLAEHRDPLREAGVLYPFLRPGAMFRGAVEIRGSHDKFGLEAAEVEGVWAALCARACEYVEQRPDRVAVISHEVLAGATPTEIAVATAPLDGLEVHVVVTARDLARQATAHWQEEVKLGATFSFRDLERDQLRVDTARDDPERPHFWHAQDVAGALARWSTAVPAERVHLVVCPPPGAPPPELWRRFADALGIDPLLVDPETAQASGGGAVNASLGRDQVAVLRSVNQALDGRLAQPGYSRLAKRVLAERVLAGQQGEPPRTPADLVRAFSDVTETWLAEVAARGYPVHGRVEDLRPGAVLEEAGQEAGQEAGHPDDVDPARVAEAAVAALAELVTLLPEPAGPPPSAAPVAPSRTGRRSWWRRTLGA